MTESSLCGSQAADRRAGKQLRWAYPPSFRFQRAGDKLNNRYLTVAVTRLRRSVENSPPDVVRINRHANRLVE